MAQTVRDVMTANPRAVDANDPIIDAARIMRDDDVGAVIVKQDGGRVAGIVTDRDIVVRALADDRDPGETSVGEIASKDLVALSPDDTLERAADVMREKSVRRLPVMQGEQPVGIVSIGDLAIENDSESALADISAAPANN
ncbi:MAG: CBS domain-containing protein [Candidatus Dormibacteria bacterium]